MAELEEAGGEEPEVVEEVAAPTVETTCVRVTVADRVVIVCRGSVVGGLLLVGSF